MIILGALLFEFCLDDPTPPDDEEEEEEEEVEEATAEVEELL